MSNLLNNKVMLADGTVLIDLTKDTVTQADVLNNKKFHDKTGATLLGTCTFDADTSNDDATASEILSTKKAHAMGAQLVGTMPNIGQTTLEITDLTGVVITKGYHDGSGTAKVSDAEASKIIGANIREGVTILGVDGTMSGSEDEHPETGKEVIPTMQDQVITPGTGFTCFREITVKAIPYTETENAAGGLTVTIG